MLIVTEAAEDLKMDFLGSNSEDSSDPGYYSDYFSVQMQESSVTVKKESQLVQVLHDKPTTLEYQRLRL